MPLLPALPRRRLLMVASASTLVPVMAAPTAAPPAAVAPPASAPVSGTPPMDVLRERVAARERAFAATMAARDFAAFGRFVSPEAVFLSGPGPSLVGRDAVLAQWKAFFDGPEAPFSWAPDRVEVLASGRLATTTGPVHLPDGSNPTRFHSTWRLDDDGEWRVVFDTGYRVCRCVDAKP